MNMVTCQVFSVKLPEFLPDSCYNGAMSGEALVAERLRTERDRRHYNQQGLGKAVGMAQTTISKWEAGDLSAPLLWIRGLAREFNVSTDYLLGVTDDRRPVAEVTEQQKTLAAMSDQGLLSMQMYVELPAGDQAVIDGLIRNLDEKRKSIERVQSAFELVELAGRFGGERARAAVLRIINEKVPGEDALAEVGSAQKPGVLLGGGS
jgi:transcriptional regulator with XRE-family HTH domain